ncbi:MAG: 30S ribosomal protein S16 [Myxococcota bacterium]
MVKVRLFRTGATKRPSYRIVAIDSRRARQGRFLEILGTYEPRRDGALRLDEERVQAWVAKGAQLSNTVRSLLRRKRSADRLQAALPGSEPAPGAQPQATPEPAASAASGASDPAPAEEGAS